MLQLYVPESRLREFLTLLHNFLYYSDFDVIFSNQVVHFND